MYFFFFSFLTTTIDILLVKYPEAAISIVGDFNDLEDSLLLQIDRFKQVVTEPTRGPNILDKIVTNCHNVYRNTQILPPVGMSDHNCLLWHPSLQSCASLNKIRKKIVRPLRDSGIREFGTWLINHSWDDVYLTDDPSTKCELFVSTLQKNVDRFLPTETISLHKNDKPWMNCEIKSLILQRQRAWHENNEVLRRYLRTE